jgi:hypothetical protein
MKFLVWAVGILAVVALVIVTFFAYMGLFSKMAVAEKMMGPYTGVYESYVGDYMKIGQVFERVNGNMKNEGITCGQSFGVYYDDPRQVPKEKLRSECGVILGDKDLAKAKGLKKKYQIKTLPAKMSLVTEFPIKNVMSYMFGPMKAYPALENYAKDKGYQLTLAYELYDQPAKKTIYVMTFEKKP